MKKITSFFTLLCCLLAISSCRYDNYDEPQSLLTGRVIYDGEPVCVRAGGAEFVLYQDGYAFHNSIPVYVNQDGTYSAVLLMENINSYVWVMLLGNALQMIRFL